MVGQLAQAHWSLCPVRPTSFVWPRGRVLFLRRGARVARFSSATRDFTDGELAVVAERGQLYLDVSGKAALDDFPRDLVQLVPSLVCEGCPVRGRCAGMFDPSPGDVFSRDDAQVREIVASLRGVVLDLGCGEGPYADVLGPLVASGEVVYIGLDPDPERVGRLRARWPGARVYVAEAEAPPEVMPPVDHVLLLRSWNHLRNPVRVLETFAGLLRSGGTLTVVDNVVFGVVRARSAARLAEGSSAVFEHYRNDGASEAHAVVVRVAPWLTLLQRRDVGPTTSNQWLLRYRCDR